MKLKILKITSICLSLFVAYGLVLYLSTTAPTRTSPKSSPQQTSTYASASVPTPQPQKKVEVEGGPYDETLTIKAGDTLASLLSRMEISSDQAHKAIVELSKVFTPKELKVGQEIYIIYDDYADKKGYDLKFLRLRADLDHDIELVQTDSGSYQATKYEKELKRVYANVNGDIQLSLYADALKAGASPKMLYDMIKAFSYDVDFQRDIQPGTEFSLFYDSYKDEESGLERPGELLYARLVLNGKPYEVYRYQPPGGVPAYYTHKGEAIRKALLRTPIDGARVSSGFGNRIHPIKGYTKMHKGVDFAAPKGTPIYAAGDGVVELCCTFGGYGKCVRIRHNGSTKTLYGHLSSFGKGIKKGIKVKQGQVIGHVGRTGHATGNHLHFELIRNGKHVNPQKVTQMPSTKLTGKSLKEFKAVIEQIQKIKKEQEKQDFATTSL